MTLHACGRPAIKSSLDSVAPAPAGLRRSVPACCCGGIPVLSITREERLRAARIPILEAASSPVQDGRGVQTLGPRGLIEIFGLAIQELRLFNKARQDKVMQLARS